MSVALFDLGQRLAGGDASAGPCRARVSAPVLPPVDPVAVSSPAPATACWCRQPMVRARRPARRPDALLGALAELGVSPGRRAAHAGRRRSRHALPRCSSWRTRPIRRRSTPTRPRWSAGGRSAPTIRHRRGAGRDQRLRRPLGARRSARGRTRHRRLAPVARCRGPRAARSARAGRPCLGTARRCPASRLRRGRPRVLGRFSQLASLIRRRAGTGARGTAVARRRSGWPAAATRPSCTRACGWAIRWSPRASRSRHAW